MSAMISLRPLMQSVVGFDELFDWLNVSETATGDAAWPPYNIVKNGADNYEVVLAVAGFGADELSVSVENGDLFVAGEKAESAKSELIHQGIASASFRKQFRLADHVNIVGAKLENGMLTISLAKELPAAMRPRRIAVTPAIAKSAA